MSLDELKELVDKYFNIDIATKTRKQHFVYARWVFFDLALYLGFSQDMAASKLTVKRASLSQGITKLDTMDVHSKLLYNKISKEAGVRTSIEVNNKKPENNEIIEMLIKKLNKLPQDTLNNLIETRIEPFLRMNKTQK